MFLKFIEIVFNIFVLTVFNILFKMFNFDFHGSVDHNFSLFLGNALVLFLSYVIVFPMIISSLFEHYYRKFYLSYRNRKLLPKYNDAYLNPIHELFSSVSALNHMEYYCDGMREGHNLCADLLLPLIRINRDIETVNQCEHEFLFSFFNIYPSSLLISDESKNEYDRMKTKIMLSKKSDKRVIPDHLNTETLL